MKTPEEVARYHFQPGPDYIYHMAPDCEGRWVRYSDYAALELNEDALLKDNKYLRKQCDKFMGERDALTERVRELENDIQIITAPPEATGSVYLALRRQNTRLRAALEDHGIHDPRCDTTQTLKPDDCTCGLGQALKETE